jgi:hypothetical protein
MLIIGYYFVLRRLHTLHCQCWMLNVLPKPYHYLAHDILKRAQKFTSLLTGFPVDMHPKSSWPVSGNIYFP